MWFNPSGACARRRLWRALDAPGAVRMKRYRIGAFDFDSRPLVLGMEIKDEWDEPVKAQNRANRERVREEYLCEYGPRWGEQKLKNILDLKSKPLSILAFHNSFMEQVRDAFIIGAYYPALVAACALGERILNHLVLLLRADFSDTPEYKRVYGKESFDNWAVPVSVLDAWGVLLPEASAAFQALEAVRHRAVHFDPATDREDRPLALEAIGHLNRIVSVQFGAFGTQPWFMTNVPGEVYIRKSAEAQPFVRRVYLPNCVLVGPLHRIGGSGARFEVEDAHDYEIRDISDEEFIQLRRKSLGV